MSSMSVIIVLNVLILLYNRARDPELPRWNRSERAAHRMQAQIRIPHYESDEGQYVCHGRQSPGHQISIGFIYLI